MKIESIPCETCITRVMCKYNTTIECSLLTDLFKQCLSVDSYICTCRQFETALCDVFGWDFLRTLVYFDQNKDLVRIGDTLSGSRIRKNDKIYSM